MALPIVETPTFDLTLPSGKRIKYRPYLVKEEKILMMAMETGDEASLLNALTQVISSCTFGELDANEHPMYEVEFFFANMRTKSVGEKSTIGIKCRECGQGNVVSVNLEKVRVDEEGKMDSIIRCTGNLALQMRYPTIADMAKIYQVEGDIQRIYSLATLCVEEIFYGDDSFSASDHTKEEMVLFVESLDTPTFAKIRDFLESIPTTCLDVIFDCGECEAYNDVKLKGLANFFV